MIIVILKNDVRHLLSKQASLPLKYHNSLKVNIAMYKLYSTLFFAFIFCSCNVNKEHETTRAKLSSIVESVYASATVTPKESYLCRTTHSGIIEEIYIEEGQKVTKGQPLFRISNTPIVSNRIKNANINLDEAKSNYSGKNNLLDNIRIEIANLKEKIIIDSLNYTRKLKLWNQNIGSKNELEQSRLAFKNSNSQLKNLKNKYNHTKSDLRNKLIKAQNLVDAENNQLSEYQINSEIDGLIFKLFKNQGEYISPQENFAEIGNVNEYIVVMDIDETDIIKVNIGDTTIIQLEAYQENVFPAIVSRISEIKDDRTQTFSVECNFIDQPNQLYNGLSGEANIIVDKRKNVMTIPSEFLINKDRVLTSDGERQIKVGMRNLKFIEILEGIDTTLNLIKPE